MRHHREIPARGMSLVPIVNLASLLIPIALMGLQAASIHWMRATPTAMLSESLADHELPRISLEVVVTMEGFLIRGAEEVLAGPDGRPLLRCSLACDDESSYDYEGLGRLLGHVKAAYPWEDEVEIDAEAVSYGVLRHTIDAVAGRDEDLFPRVRLR